MNLYALFKERIIVTMEVVVRLAVADDLAELEQLDRICFPPGDPHRDVSEPGEIKTGVADGRIFLAETAASQDIRMAAYLYYHTDPTQLHYFVVGIGVHPSCRAQGLGVRLINTLVTMVKNSSQRELVDIAMTVSPYNIAMLKVAFQCGFAVTDYVANYFGHGRDRFYLLRDESLAQEASRRRLLIPLSAVEQTYEFLRDAAVFIVGVEALPHGQCFVLSERRRNN